MDIAPLLEDLRKGSMIILADSAERENEADLICAAEKITPDKINFMARFGRGLICAPITRAQAEKLSLPLMPVRNAMPLQHCNFTVSVDAKKGIKTGISAFDRAQTIKVLAGKKSTAADLSQPGHIFPLVAKDDGVLERPGHTEGTIDLMRLAGMSPVGVLCEIMDDDGTMLSGKKLLQFARIHGLKTISIHDILAHRRGTEKIISREVHARLPTAYGAAAIYGYKTNSDDREHIALVFGKIGKTPPLVRIHSECLTGDVLESTRCDCNEQLHSSLNRMRGEGGILIYLRHEGRGIGLINKLRTYNLQDKGLDTFEANEKLGFKADARDYSIGAHILRDLGVSSVRMMTNNPQKIADLEDFGIHVAQRIALSVKPRDALQKRYLLAKKARTRVMNLKFQNPNVK